MLTMDIFRFLACLFYYLMLTTFSCRKILAKNKRKILFFYQHYNDFVEILFFIALLKKDKQTMELFLSFFKKIERQKKFVCKAYSYFSDSLFSLNDFSYAYFIEKFGKIKAKDEIKFDYFSLDLTKRYLIVDFYGLNYISQFQHLIAKKIATYSKNKKNKPIVDFYKPYINIHFYALRQMIQFGYNIYDLKFDTLREQDFKSITFDANLVKFKKKAGKKWLAHMIIHDYDIIKENFLLEHQEHFICAYCLYPKIMYQLYQPILNKYHVSQKYYEGALNDLIFSMLFGALKARAYRSFKKIIYLLEKDGINIDYSHFTRQLNNMGLLSLECIQFATQYLVDKKVIESDFFMRKYFYKLSERQYSFYDIKWIIKQKFPLSFDNYLILNQLLRKRDIIKLGTWVELRKINFILNHLSIDEWENNFKPEDYDKTILLKNYLWYCADLNLIKKYKKFLNFDSHELFYLSLNNSPFNDFEIIFKTYPSIISEKLLFNHYNGFSPIEYAIKQHNESFIYDIFKVLNINQFSIQNIENIINYIVLEKQLKLEVKLYIVNKITINFNWSNIHIEKKDRLYPYFLQKMTINESIYLQNSLNDSLTNTTKKIRKI